jgi:hypothetical protein
MQQPPPEPDQVSGDELERLRRNLLKEYLRTCLEELSTRTGFHCAIELRDKLSVVDAELSRRRSAARGVVPDGAKPSESPRG